jgi:hypothetical protein
LHEKASKPTFRLPTCGPTSHTHSILATTTSHPTGKEGAVQDGDRVATIASTRLT